MTGKQLTVKNRLGFGVGDFGLNLFWNMTNMFVLFYYTDILHLPNAVAGNIVMGAMIWDGITDPLVGYLASRTRSRYGRYRPYMLVGAIPLALSFAMMFYQPDLKAAWLVAYVAATHILFRTFYTFVGIPYSSLSARITNDSSERGRLAVYRMLFASSAGILVAGFTLALAEVFGDSNKESGFFLVACLYSVLAVFAIFACFFLTEEKADTAVATHERVNIGDLRYLLGGNKAFLIVLAVIILGNSGGTIYSKAMLYYLKYNLGSEDLIGLFTGLAAVTIAVTIPVWGWISRLKGKCFVWLVGMCISVSTSLLLYFNPYQQPAVVMPIIIFGAVGAAAHYFSFWALLPDTVEYGEWKTGLRAESILFGLVSFGQKISLGIAVGALGFMLDAIGYRANEIQSAETINGIHFIITIVPMGFALMCLYLITRFPFTDDEHSKMAEEIAQRRQGTKREKS